MKSIDDIVANLSPEEKEIHRELIEECKIREDSLKEIRKEINENIKKMTAAKKNIISNIVKIYKLSEILNNSCKSVKDNTLKDALALIPEEKFIRA